MASASCQSEAGKKVGLPWEQMLSVNQKGNKQSSLHKKKKKQVELVCVCVFPSCDSIFPLLTVQSEKDFVTK